MTSHGPRRKRSASEHRMPEERTLMKPRFTAENKHDQAAVVELEEPSSAAKTPFTGGKNVSEHRQRNPGAFYVSDYPNFDALVIGPRQWQAYPLETHAANTSTRNNVLTISLSQHLTGEPISQVIEADWSTKAEVATQARFNNIGFDLNPSNLFATMGELRQTLQGGRWDGFLIGWCSRGYPRAG
ncbi:hypothetical protein LTS16_026441 [Friedmanniomyces endolithicus]|nr:hypothetical protein LTS01_025184 [Friedmanniomyces endolithicus]KAK1021530.1 hypothetical protein LTS16_026441 [Friedmanniomyces endolithicus]